jgi:hypothetical protein
MVAIAFETPAGHRKRPHRHHRPHPKAFIASASGVKLVLPYAPNEVDYDGLALDWETVDRPGRKPLVTYTADGLRSLSFTVILSHLDHQDDIEGMLSKLRRLAKSHTRLTVGLDTLSRGAWRLTACPVHSQLRQHGTNNITRATVDLTFLEATDSDHHGPLTGGHKRNVDKWPAAYRVRAGDTLASIAALLGDPALWPLLAAVNGIRNPTKPLTPGRVLTIPPRSTIPPPLR